MCRGRARPAAQVDRAGAVRRAHRAEAIGKPVDELRATGLAGTPAEVVDRLGRWRTRTGISRVYLEVLDLHDLDHVELVAAEVFPQL